MKVFDVHRLAIASALFAESLALGGCSDFGLGTTLGPLPGNSLPPQQTLEGGEQIRLTAAGLQKLTSFVPGALNQALSSSAQCVPEGTVGTTTYCGAASPSCGVGCPVSFALQSVTMSASNAQTLHVAVKATASASVSESSMFLGSCTLGYSTNLISAVDVTFAIDASSGALVVTAGNGSVSSSPSFTGCASGDPNVVIGVDDAVQTQYLLDVLTPTVDEIIADLFPQTSLAGTVDASALLVGPGVGNGAKLETRLLFGGYASLTNGGLSLGVITGFNSDADPTTRTGALASEPAPCVANLVAPDFLRHRTPCRSTRAAHSTSRRKGRSRVSPTHRPILRSPSRRRRSISPGIMPWRRAGSASRSTPATSRSFGETCSTICSGFLSGSPTHLRESPFTLRAGSRSPSVTGVHLRRW